MNTAIGVPPKPVTALLRLDGLAVAIAAIVAFSVTGGNWWLFALLILAPDLSFAATVAGPRHMHLRSDERRQGYLSCIIEAGLSRHNPFGAAHAPLAGGSANPTRQIEAAVLGTKESSNGKSPG